LLAAAFATAGWLVPAWLWQVLLVAGAATSAVTLALFLHPWIVLGFAIDAALLWAALVAGWAPAASAR
jgi:hypothetical protein